MAEAVPSDLVDDVPEDTFGVRLAIIEAVRGWNHKQAAEACELDPENWRLWIKTDRKPRDYEAVCRRIARGSRFPIEWVMLGGPLRTGSFSPWLSMVEPELGQCSLFDQDGTPLVTNDRPVLASVGSA